MIFIDGVCNQCGEAFGFNGNLEDLTEMYCNFCGEVTMTHSSIANLKNRVPRPKPNMPKGVKPIIDLKNLIGD